MNKKFIVRSNGQSIRDFIYVDDIVELYKKLSKNLYTNPKKFSGQIFNAGTNNQHKIKDIIEKIFIYGKKKNELKSIFKKMKNKKTTGELSIQYMDYEKINHYLGLHPKYKFTKTLPALFNWYKKLIFKNN